LFTIEGGWKLEGLKLMVSHVGWADLGMFGVQSSGILHR